MDRRSANVDGAGEISTRSDRGARRRLTSRNGASAMTSLWLGYLHLARPATECISQCRPGAAVRPELAVFVQSRVKHWQPIFFLAGCHSKKATVGQLQRSSKLTPTLHPHTIASHPNVHPSPRPATQSLYRLLRRRIKSSISPEGASPNPGAAVATSANHDARRSFPSCDRIPRALRSHHVDADAGGHEARCLAAGQNAFGPAGPHAVTLPRRDAPRIDAVFQRRARRLFPSRSAFVAAARQEVARNHGTHGPDGHGVPQL